MYTLKSQQNNKSGAGSFLTRHNLFILGAILLVILLFVGFYLFFLKRDTPKVDKGSVEQPLNFYSDKKVDIPQDTTVDDEKRFDILPIFDISDVSHIDDVQEFLRQVGKGLLRKEDYEVVYYWREDPEDNLNLIEYNLLLDRVTFRFEEPVSLSAFEQGVVTREEVPAYFQAFVQEYFNDSFEYADFNVVKQGNRWRVEARRLIGEVPMAVPGYEKYTDFAVFEDDGDLVEGLVYLMTYDEDSAFEVSLLDPIEVAGLISRYDYPKQFNQRFPEDFDYSTVEKPYETDPEGVFLGDPPPQLGDYDEIEIPEADACTASSVKIVYLYQSKSFKKLSPAFEIDCVGEVTYKSKDYSVDIVVYASAIDPEYVYVPADL